MDDGATSESTSSYGKFWVEWFQSLKGNELFCEIDEEYILDRFNLTGLQTAVPHFSLAFELITDELEEELDEDIRTEVDKAAKHLYGLIHARYIISQRGLTKMSEKFKLGDFGRCPRALCGGQPVLPVGLSDIPQTKSVKLFCPKCEDVYTPPSRRHAGVDGAYFGTTFPHLLLQTFPNLMPTKSMEVYTPRIFGFRVYEKSKEERKREELREELNRRARMGMAEE